MLKVILSILFICSTAFASDIHLEWVANSEPDLKGYNIHYGDSSRFLDGEELTTFKYDTVLFVSSATTYNILNVPDGTYYISLTAVDHDGNESDYSEEKVLTVDDTAPAVVVILKADVIKKSYKVTIIPE